MLRFRSIAVLLFAGFLSSQVFAANTSPAYSATLAGGKTLSLKVDNFNLFSLLQLSTSAGKDLTGSALIGITVKNGSSVVVLTSNANSFTYSVTTNKKTNIPSARGKGTGLAFSAVSGGKSTLTVKVDVSAVASKLPQTSGNHPKPTLEGATQFTLIIGSAQFVGSIDSKGKVTYTSP